MGLKLETPWGTELLLVPYDRVTAVIRQCGGPHIQRDGDDMLVREFFEADNRVPDVSRYRIDAACANVPHDTYHICDDRFIIPHCDLSEQEDISHCDISGSALVQELRRRPQIRNIVLLLESPHKKEYNGNIMWPKAPACGPTGKRIDRYLGTVLSHIQAGVIETECHVIISNPVQFQTSLHAIHQRSLQGKWKTLRDNVWRTLWYQPCIRQDFQERLDGYSPGVIINACTKSLKRHVRTYVGTLFNENGQVTPPYYEVVHPASWHAHTTPTLLSLN